MDLHLGAPEFAPLDVDLSGVCSYCKAPIMSGDYDWVLARIDQLQ